MSKRLVVFAAAILLTFVSWSGASAAPAPAPLASLEAAIFAPASPAVAPAVAPIDAAPVFSLNPPVTGPQCCNAQHLCSTCGPEGYTCVVSTPGICGANGACVCNP